VRLEIGPVPASGVRAWVDDAVAALSAIHEGRRDLKFQVPDEILGEMLSWLGQWQEAAESDPMVWAADDVDPDNLLQLVQYWHNIARAQLDLVWQDLAPAVSPDGEAFADHVRDRVLTALVAEGRLDRAGADRILAGWPDARQARTAQRARLEEGARGPSELEAPEACDG
jgi:hypothetical protein